MEHYCSTENRDPSGDYLFTLDMSEGISYDAELYVMSECTPERFRDFTSVRLDMDWISPSGGHYCESVYLGGDKIIKSTYFWRQLGGRYREGMVPSERGVWTLCVHADERTIRDYSLSGMGVRLIANR